MTTPGKSEFPSLLFTPRTGDKPSQSDYRTSRPARSPSTPAYGRASTREGATPMRRSLTPAGSVKDTPPPPPPSESMLMLEAASGWARQLDAGPTPSREAPEPTPASRLGRAPAIGSAKPAAAFEDELWVTVFGFQPNDKSIVLMEFAKCGDIKEIGSGRDDAVNWMHLKYANKYQAQRALQRDGEMLTERLMVGVKRLDVRHRASAAALEGHDLPLALRPEAPPVPARALAPRPYRLDAYSADQGALPKPERSTWAKVNAFVFGL